MHPNQYLNKSIQGKSTFIRREVAGNNVLISIGGNIANFNGYIELNDSAAFVWKSIASPVKFEDLVQLFANEFNLTEEQAAEDLTQFIDELTDSQMADII